MGKPISGNEIKKLLQQRNWGTIIAIDDSRPYAVETSFATDETCLYTGTKRGGRMHRCIEKNPAVAFKVCDGDHRGHNYRAAIIESRAEILTGREDILQCIRIIFEKLGLATDSLEAKADAYTTGTGALALYRLPLDTMSGIASGSGRTTV
jgi:nitroimidazol reductase NimA-like FMN-containing flavoprotein (pyridoxamine 5'-phosphate oxidase superfamily)